MGPVLTVWVFPLSHVHRMDMRKPSPPISFWKTLPVNQQPLKPHHSRIMLACGVGEHAETDNGYWRGLLLGTH